MVAVVQVVFKARGIGNPPVRVVDEAHQTLALGVLLVAGNVDEELFADLLVHQSLAGLLDLDDGFDLRQQKIRARGRAGIARRPFFGSYVVEMQSQERVHQILDIVFVDDIESLTALSTLTQLQRNGMKTQHDTVEFVQ